VKRHKNAIITMLDILNLIALATLICYNMAECTLSIAKYLLEEVKIA